jgi:hypothetical protein
MGNPLQLGPKGSAFAGRTLRDELDFPEIGTYYFLGVRFPDRPAALPSGSQYGTPMDTLFDLLAVVIVLVGAAAGMRLLVRFRQGAGSMTTIMLGATDEFLTEEKRKAAETIVNDHAGKTFESVCSGQDRGADPHHGASVFPPDPAPPEKVPGRTAP